MRRSQALARAVTKAIKQALHESGMSERQLSKKLRQHKNYINEILRGQHQVRVEEFIQIAQGLGLSPFDLLSRVLRP